MQVVDVRAIFDGAETDFVSAADDRSSFCTAVSRANLTDSLLLGK